MIRLSKTSISIFHVFLIVTGLVILFRVALVGYSDAFSHFSPPAWRSRVQGAHPGDQNLSLIKNETLGFEKVFAVSLPERTDHRDALRLSSIMTGFHIDFVDGVKTDDVPEKTLPYPAEKKEFNGGDLGAWRAHMNALNQVIDSNLATALIFEDDIDFDVRIKDQLLDYALTVRALTQPIVKEQDSRYANRTHPPDLNAGRHTHISDRLDFHHLPVTENPKFSPYGDEWDILWLGHCAASSPDPEANDNRIPRGMVIHHNDATVPHYRHFDGWANSGLGQGGYPTKYPPHTRLTHYSDGQVCSFAYAVTQSAARYLLYETSLKLLNSPFDIMLQQICEGKNGHAKLRCLTVQPQLFNHHRARGKIKYDSDIASLTGDAREVAVTEFVRQSTRLNLEQMLNGQAADSDQWPDD